MSFENEYIEKYGQKAVEVYKRSLRHSDVKENSSKTSIGKGKMKRSSSCSRNLSQNKSSQAPYLKKTARNSGNYEK